MSFVRVVALLAPAPMFLALLACEPLSDTCEVEDTLAPVPTDETGPAGYAAVDGLIPAGTYRVEDGGYDLLVTLRWDAEAVPRVRAWKDGDNDGVVAEEGCAMDYSVGGTLTVDSGDGRYDERGRDTAVAAAEGEPGGLWVVIDRHDVRGEEVPGRALWLEVFHDGEQPQFSLAEVRLDGTSETLAMGPLAPAEG